MPEEMQPQQQPPVKRASTRAKIACRRCNSKRVKCDMVQSHPCQNCRTRNLVCEPLVSRRGRYSRSAPKLHNKTPEASTSASQSTLASSLPLGAHATPPASDQEGGTRDGSDGQNQNGEGSDMLFARITETSPGEDQTELPVSNGRTFYLSEPFSLSYMVNVVCSPPGSAQGAVVHFPIPASVSERTGDGIYMGAAQKEYLKSCKAFEMVKKPVSDELLRLYFEYFHPAYPVFDRNVFAALYRVDRLSPLVMQTIYYIGATLCDEELLRGAGFTDRSDACITFYLRAKALYDCDYERDKVTITAVLFILGFVWQNPEDQKDSWHWLGHAISLAQTLGMHRSTAQSALLPHHRSLWKRVWWSIYIRDRHAAAALGRPVRIRDEDCDVESLDWTDFQDIGASSVKCLGQIEKHHISYVIEMSKLAVIFGRILTASFTPARVVSPEEESALSQELVEWKDSLPPELQHEDDERGFGATFWTRMQSVAYSTCQILVNRPRHIIPTDVRRESMAATATNRITRIAEDLLATDTLKYSQLHLIPGLFAALSVLSIDIRRKDPIRRQLAENRSRQCMLALKVLSKRWPVGGWILRLFISLLSRLTGGNFGFEQHRQPTLQTDSSNYHPHSPNTLMDPLTNGQNMNQMGIGQPFPLGEQGGLNEHLDLHLDVPDFWDQGIFSLDYLFHDTFLPPAQTGHLADLGDIDEGQ